MTKEGAVPKTRPTGGYLWALRAPGHGPGAVWMRGGAKRGFAERGRYGIMLGLCILAADAPCRREHATGGARKP